MKEKKTGEKDKKQNRKEREKKQERKRERKSNKGSEEWIRFPFIQIERDIIDDCEPFPSISFIFFLLFISFILSFILFLFYFTQFFSSTLRAPFLPHDFHSFLTLNPNQLYEHRM